MSISITKFTFAEPEERSFVLLKKGRYPFRILRFNAVETSKSGNPMIPVELEVGDDDSGRTKVYENLVFVEAAAWKINQFVKALYPEIKPGKDLNWEDPAFLEWLKGRTGGQVDVDEEPVAGKDYKRNKIVAFVIEKDEAPAPVERPKPAAAPAKDIDDDDDIPF